MMMMMMMGPSNRYCCCCSENRWHLHCYLQKVSWNRLYRHVDRIVLLYSTALLVSDGSRWRTPGMDNTAAVDAVEGRPCYYFVDFVGTNRYSSSPWRGKDVSWTLTQWGKIISLSRPRYSLIKITFRFMGMIILCCVFVKLHDRVKYYVNVLD